MPADFFVPEIPFPILSHVGKKIGTEIDKLKLDLRIGLEGYYKSLYKRVSRYRTVLTLEKDVSLKETYEDLTYIHNKKEYKGFDIWRGFSPGERYLIRGLGGTGKSLFSKMCTMWSLESNSDRFVMHIDLKVVNDHQVIDFSTIIINDIQDALFKLKKDNIEYIINNLNILIILDGFDEVDDNKRGSVLKSINRFSEARQNVAIMITSRPHEAEGSWVGYKIFDIQPMSMIETRSLVEKFPYDVSVKNKFLEDLGDRIWPNHKSFAENPLLCTLVILAYARDGFLFDRLSDFYQQAFDAVLFRHDKSKEFYIRQLISGISISKCESIFAAFCFYSYLKNKKKFSKNEIIEYIEKSLSVEGVDADPLFVLRDFVESVCLIVKEGLEYKFSHRSFQEYFSAKFAQKSSYDVKKVCDKFSSRFHDISMLMYYQLNTDAVIKNWLLSRYNYLSDADVSQEIEEANLIWCLEAGISVDLKYTTFISTLDELLRLSTDPADTFLRAAGVHYAFLRTSIIDTISKIKMPEEQGYTLDGVRSVFHDPRHNIQINGKKILIPMEVVRRNSENQYMEVVHAVCDLRSKVLDYFEEDCNRCQGRSDFLDLL